METIKGKHILLLGATGGIGSKTAKILASAGANIFLCARDRQKLTALANELNIPGANVFAADITRPEEVTLLKEHFFKVFSQVDILINASGIGIIKSSDVLTPEEFMQTININLYAPFLIIKAFLPAMKEQKKGFIIHIPGILGKIPMLGAAAYSASKYGLTGMLQSVREEVKRTEIRITNLFLGGVDTPFWDNIDLRVQRDKMVMAEEAARTIWFLCQQPSSAVVSEMVVQPFNHQAI